MFEIFNKWFGKRPQVDFQKVELVYSEVEELINVYINELIQYNHVDGSFDNFYYGVKRVYLIQLNHERDLYLKHKKYTLPFEDSTEVFNRVTSKVNTNMNKIITNIKGE